MSDLPRCRRMLFLSAIGMLLAAPAVWSQPAAEQVAASDARSVADDSSTRDLTDIDRIIAAGRDDNQVMAHLDHLANRIGPRLTSSDNLTVACEWSRDLFDQLGLANAHLEKWGEWPVGFNRGPSTGRMVSPEPMPLEFGTNAWTAGTKGKQRGPARFAPTTTEELAAQRDQLAGAWLLAVAPARRGARGQRATNGPTDPASPGSGPPASGARRGRRGGRGGGRRGFNDPFRAELEIAARESGALGVITRDSDELIVTAGRRPETAGFFDNLPTLPQITMTATSYDAIAEQLRAGGEVELEFDIRNHFKKGPIPLYNVVADLTGSELPDEYVIVCGHLDSWDAGTGTTDNGTGCATTIEAARILLAAGVHPKRTIRFVLWTGEEQGLFGSEEYVKTHADEISRISAVLNHDVGTQYISSVKTLPYQRADLERVFAPVMSLNPAFPFRLEPDDSLAGLGSDHAPFNRVGVPGFLWGQSGDLANYNETHHTQYDTFDRAVPAYQEHSSIVVALAAYGLANLDHLLPRERVTESE